MKPAHPAMLPALSLLVSCLLVPQQQQPGQQLEQQHWFSRRARAAPSQIIGTLVLCPSGTPERGRFFLGPILPVNCKFQIPN